MFTLLFAQLYYLDHLYDNAAQIDCGTPRIKYFDKERWENLIKADHKDGRWGLCPVSTWCIFFVYFIIGLVGKYATVYSL